jgi:hypothetical protein
MSVDQRHLQPLDRAARTPRTPPPFATRSDLVVVAVLGTLALPALAYVLIVHAYLEPT